MTPERWQVIKEVFLGALEQEADQRFDFLAGACGDDADLQREVETLLADHEHADGFIERPALDTGVTWPGRMLGAYRILDQIDEGGMGTVYLAQRADSQYSQKVAVKLIRRGMVSELAVSRFRQERQILAHLNHPGIARLLDGGTTEDGQPYLVMEYIEGEPIDDYCDRRQLFIDQRLELFRKVCAAVHYAHQNLVIHRDIKPNNILVTPAGEPKLLDFGTAKLLEPALAETDVASTVTGSRLMTPEYASPEQLRAQPITTASDVYALGVVLYELLTGQRPYHFASRHSPEVSRIVCEQEPERPSTMAPEKRRRLRGDLDKIALMALRKEPERRYASVGQLSQDIHHHLTGLPVAARKDTWSYHLGKFVGRHRVAVAAGGLAAFAIVVGAMIAVWQARVAHSEWERAEIHLAEAREQRTKAEQVSSFLVDIFEVSSPSQAQGQELTAREILQRGEEKIRTELHDQPDVRATMMDTIGVVYQNIAMYEQAESLMEEALELRLQVSGERHLDTATTWSHVGLLALEQGHYEKAEPLLERALELRQELLDEKDPLVAASLDDLGRLHHDLGDFAGAEALHLRALEMRRELFPTESREIAESLNNMATALWNAGRPGDAEPLLRKALQIRRQLFGRLHPDITNSLNNLVVLLFNQSDFDAAEPLVSEILDIDRELLGDEHPTLAHDLDLLAAVRFGQERFDEAKALYSQTLDMRHKVLDAEHPDIAFSYYNLAAVMQKQGNYGEAEKLHRKALELRQKVLGADHPYVVVSLETLARLLRNLKRHDEALSFYRQSLAIHHRSQAVGRRSVASIESELGECLTALGRFGEAEDLLLPAHAALKTKLGPLAQPVIEARERLIKLYQDWGKKDLEEQWRARLPTP